MDKIETTGEAMAAVEREMFSVIGPLALMAGMQLDLFSELEAAPRNAAELAAKLDVEERRLSELLYALAVDGWLQQEGGRFQNGGVASRVLVSGKPDCVLGVQKLTLDLVEALLHTAESVRTGEPQLKHDFAAMSRAELETFFGGLHPMTLKNGALLATRGEFDGVHHLLDVGGGSGGISIAACGVLPELRSTVAELPTVAPITRDYIQRAGLAERIDVLEHDAVADPIEGAFDAAILRAFLQVLSEEQCRAALRHIANALAPGARLLVLARALDDDRMGPAPTVLFNLAFLNIYDEGRAWTEAEHRAWFAETGFVDVERETLPTGHSVFRARRARA